MTGSGQRHRYPWMCSHYIAESAREKLERIGAFVPPEWVPPSGGFHIFPSQQTLIIRRPPERDSGEEVVLAMLLVTAHFGLLLGFAKDNHYGKRTYGRSRNARLDLSA